MSGAGSAQNPASLFDLLSWLMTAVGSILHGREGGWYISRSLSPAPFDLPSPEGVGAYQG
jgi:hypothetical protein